MAKAGGTEITSGELALEAKASGAQLTGAGADKLRNAVLDRVVARTLLADEARRQKLDQTPDFLLQRRRDEETLLAGALLRKSIDPNPKLNDAEVAAFIQQNPRMFAGRQALLVDQLRFPATAYRPGLEDGATSLDQLADKLNQLGIPFERGTATVDTATLPPELASQNLTVEAPHPLRYDTNGLVTFNSVKAAKPVALTSDQQQQLARNALRMRRLDEATRAMVDRLRDSAKVTYQKGYAAPKAS